MKLNNFNNLIFDTIDDSEITEMEIAYRLGIDRANISSWRSERRIPEKHFKNLCNILKIPNTRSILALQKDISENFK